MNTYLGIALESWVNINSECPMKSEVHRPHDIEIELGHSTGSLHLVLTEQGLGELVKVATGALARVHELESGFGENREVV